MSIQDISHSYLWLDKGDNHFAYSFWSIKVLVSAQHEAQGGIGKYMNHYGLYLWYLWVELSVKLNSTMENDNFSLGLPSIEM